MDNHNPLDEITSGEFIYEALRVAVAVALILIATYILYETFNLEKIL